MKKVILTLILATGLLVGCKDSSDDEKGTQVQKKESVIVNIKESDNDNLNVLNLTYQVFDANGNLIRTFVKKDTLPYLGTKTDTLDTEVEDSSVVKVVPKKYNYFITFK